MNNTAQFHGVRAGTASGAAAAVFSAGLLLRSLTLLSQPGG